MENKGGSLPTGLAIFFLGLWPVLGAIFAAGSVKPAPPPSRTVAVEVIADTSLRKNERWKVDIFCVVRDVSQVLEKVAGIKLTIKTYDYWTPGNILVETPISWHPTTLAKILSGFNSHIREVGRGSCEIIIGLVPEGPDGPVFPGIADYLTGTVMIKNLKCKGGIKYVLLHEICHLFGAIDLRVGNTVMSLQNPGFRIDDFTKAIIKVNRQRSFRPGDCPLSEEGILGAVGLYKDRQSLGLGEDELAICLGKLRTMRADSRPVRY
jgi:hypothetical protein